MTISSESKEFFSKLSKIWQNFKDYSYLEGINLSPQQISIIEQDEDQLLIEGYAGTGKSLTLLYKFINVLVREESKKVLFVTYNSTLIQDTRKRLNNCKEYIENRERHTADIKTFHQMASDILKQIKVIDRGIGKLNIEMQNKMSDDALRRIASILAKYKEANSDIFKSLPREERLYSTHDRGFVRDEIAWIKAMGFIQLDKYLNTDRIGRNKSVRLTRNQRKTIFKIFEEYQKELESMKYGSTMDLEDYALKIIQNKHLLSEEIKYDYIFVDEVQDLDPMQIMALCMLTKKSIVLSGDAKQRIYKKCPVKYEDLGLNVRQKGKRKVLSKNYRSTAEIVNLANSLNFYDSEEKLSAKEYVKNGEKPVIHRTNDNATAIRYITNHIKKIQQSDPKKTVAIINREEVKQKTGERKSIFRLELEGKLMQRVTDINSYYTKFDFSKEKQIFYANSYDIKGLEFDVVFIVDFNNSYYPSEKGLSKIREKNDGKDEALISEDILEFINTEKKLLYVAMTRAKEKLYLIANNVKSVNNISEFIFDFQSKDYESSGFDKIDIERARVSYNRIGHGKLFIQKEKEKQAKIEADIKKSMENMLDIKEAQDTKAEVVAESIKVEEKIKSREVEIKEAIKPRVEKLPIKDEVELKEKTPEAPIVDVRETVREKKVEEQLVNTSDIVESVVKPVLTKHKIKFIDNRDKKGAFWVMGGQELESLLSPFKQYGITFLFAKNGGRATKRMPAWYIK